jgi:OFA family oxalate/formate antiporter-like MFS transporter
MNSSKYSRKPFDPSKWPFFYGWMIILMGTLGILMSIPGQTIGVSTFTDSLIDVLDISRDQISLAYMIGTVLSSLLLTKAGKLYDTHGVRVVAGVGSFALGLSLILLSQVDKITKWMNISGQIIPIVFLMIIGFSLIRFFGQGVLTLASRTMMMLWFDARRGFATSFSSVFTALGFSASPYYIELLIQQYNWNGAWIILGIIAAFIFPIFIIIFFRNKPQDIGLSPDGGKINKKEPSLLFPILKEFSLSEAKQKLIFWVISLFLAMQALYITGFTFHVVSIFETAGFSRGEAVGIFQPIAVISVAASLTFGWVSDYIKINILLFAKGLSSLISLVGLIYLGQYEFAKFMIIFGIGVMTGLFGVVSIVALPRLFGKKSLGAISGFCMTITVFGSALGPMLFSLSLSQTGNYTMAALVTIVMFFTLTLFVFKINNPQILLKEQATKLPH